MAASVLGKRSRRVIDAEDITSALPAAKRQTRRAAPSIYEDKCDNVSTHRAAADSALPKSRPIRSTRSKQSRTTKAGNNGEDASTQKPSASSIEPAEDLMDFENIPPFVLSTPTTIRHQDFLVSQIPSTPKRRVKLAGICLTPKSSKQPQSSSRSQSAFSAARQLFASSNCSTRLVGREFERQQIQQFIANSIESRVGGCTYVSGPPGTGKSAFVQDVFNGFENSDSVQVSALNCVSLRTANDVYSKLLQEFCPDASVGKTGLRQHLSKFFLDNSSSRMRLILLDEIDNLIDTDCEVLYTLFEWAMHRSSSIILVGIANALDLTDRFLPRLKAKGLKPNLVPFLPYTAQQISTIITDKLRSLLPDNKVAANDFVPFLQPAAVQLCGKKIASQTGDLRKAFSLVRRIIDQVEKETISKSKLASPSKKPLGEISNLVSLPPTPTSSPMKAECAVIETFTAETAPRATIAHAAKMASSIFSNGTLSRLSGLNLQQKAVLCSLVAGEKKKAERNPYLTPSKSTSRVPSVKDLFVKYSVLCKRDDGILQPLKDTEFRDVVASLETLGLVHEHRGRTSSLLTPTTTPSRAGRNSDERQIISAVSEKEMRESLTGAGSDLLSRLLDEY